MVSPAEFARVFAEALEYGAYLATAKPHELNNWRAFESRVSLTGAQTALVRSLTRRVNILVISGTWCGDCVQQCPILVNIERAFAAPRDNPDAPGIDLRFIDRDEHIAFADRFMICGGNRVPTVIFLNEEFDFVSVMGDRSLSRYRAIAQRQLGPSCPLPGAPVPPDEIAATAQDWLNELERVALLLRLSPKLRAKHND